MFQFHPGNWPARKGRNCNFCGTRSDPTFVVMHFWGGADVFYNKSTASAVLLGSAKQSSLAFRLALYDVQYNYGSYVVDSLSI